MAQDDDKPVSLTEERQSSGGPLVFVSHDSRDDTIAEAFCSLLSNVSAGMLQTFRSSDRKGSTGFEYGVEWYPELMKRLEVACDVVCLLTRRSLNRPWLLYEAGVAKGKLDVPVHGLALGVPLSIAGTGPFAQFQNCDDDRDSIVKLVVQLVKRLPHASPNEDLVRSQVDGFLAGIATAVAAEGDGGDDGPAAFDDESAAKLFEEIKVMFQDLPTRIERAAVSGIDRPDRMKRLSPGMIEELLGELRFPESGAGVPALVIASFVAEDFPWLGSMAAAIYEAELAGNRTVARRAVYQFLRATDVAGHSPMTRRPSSRMVRDLGMMAEHFVMRAMEAEPPDLEDTAPDG